MKANKRLTINWTDSELPNLVLAYNTIETAAQASFLVLLWCRPADPNYIREEEKLIGQARVSLADLTSNVSAAGEIPFAFSLQKSALCLSNKLLGQVHSKLRFSTL